MLAQVVMVALKALEIFHLPQLIEALMAQVFRQVEHGPLNNLYNMMINNLFMRDKNSTKEHFDEVLELAQEYTHNEDWFASYREQNKNNTGEEGINFFPLLDAHCISLAQDVPYMYCRGDSLAAIEQFRIQLLADRCVEVAQEIKTQGYLEKRYFFINMIDPHDIHSVYCLLCWLLCFNVDPEKIAAFAPIIAPAGKDRLIDSVLSRYQPDREIALASGNAATFQLLDDCITATDEQRVEFLQKYIKDWGKLLSNLKGLSSIGIHRQKKLTNKTLHKELEGKNITYKGFWMWEVALLVKFFGINDEPFRDNEYYPADMVHYKG